MWGSRKLAAQTGTDSVHFPLTPRYEANVRGQRKCCNEAIRAIFSSFDAVLLECATPKGHSRPRTWTPLDFDVPDAVRERLCTDHDVLDQHTRGRQRLATYRRFPTLTLSRHAETSLNTW